MRIATYTPKLTIAEADRCWMLPIDVCALAAIGDAEKPDVRRFLSNISDRGHIPFEKSGEAKTKPRLYSCISAIILRTMREITDSGRSYEFAAPIAEHVGNLVRGLIRDCASLDELDTGDPDWIVIYQARWNGSAHKIKTIRSADFRPAIFVGGSYDHGVFLAGDVIWNALRHYADYWARDRVARGIDQPSRYDGGDDKGYPLDPGHPWNRDLPPLERAKRLVEIEDFIARREAERDKEGNSLILRNVAR